MKPNIILLFAALLLAVSCKEETFPKPKAMLRLDYPKSQYIAFNGDCNYNIQVNEVSSLKQKEDCSMVIDYPIMKGSIYLTYKPVNANINTLLSDTQKLSYEHVGKADNIIEQPFINSEKEVYGMYYEVTGNAASQAQFYVTDSINHFVTGSLYFYAKPNYDSIYPAANYLQKDIRRIMESITWK